MERKKAKAAIYSLIQEKQLVESTLCSFCTGGSVIPSALPVADEKMSFYPKSLELPAMCTPLYLQHFGIRSTIWTSSPISHPEARFVLDLIPTPIFWDELILFYLPQNSHIQRKVRAIIKFLVGTFFIVFFKP